MTKDEMKDRISLALKDPILQQGFEIICKENAELKSIADFQQSSNMDRYFQLKRSKGQLTKAKEIIQTLIKSLEVFCGSRTIDLKVVQEAKQFLEEENEKDYPQEAEK